MTHFRLNITCKAPTGRRFQMFQRRINRHAAKYPEVSARVAAADAGKGIEVNLDLELSTVRKYRLGLRDFLQLRDLGTVNFDRMEMGRVRRSFQEIVRTLRWIERTENKRKGRARWLRRRSSRTSTTSS